MKYFILIFFAGLFLMILISRDRFYYTVEYIVPNGYSGPLVIMENDKDKTIIEINDKNIYVVKFDANGCAKVNNADFLTNFHKESAMYENGKIIPVEFVTEENPGYIGSYRANKTNGRACSFGFIGKPSDKRRFFDSDLDAEKNKWLDKIIFNSN